LIDGARSVGGITAAIQPEVAERLIQRMCDAVIARASQGEVLRLGVDRESDRCAVWISRPAALANLPESQMFGSADNAMSEEFPLRLARGLAHSAGVDVAVTPTAIRLGFPRA
jgi:hypothetical protein